MMMVFTASWRTALVEKQTAGRLTLGDAHGTLWRGSAFVGGAANGSDPVTPLLPGRFSWRLSPMVLLGSVDADQREGQLASMASESGGDFITGGKVGRSGRTAEHSAAVRPDALIMGTAAIDAAEWGNRDGRSYETGNERYRIAAVTGQTAGQL